MTKSPTGAVLRSLALPGWGQFYNEQYWKTPIFVGAVGTLIYFAIDNHNQYLDYKRLEQSLPEDDPRRQIARRNKESFQDNRDQVLFYTIGVYIVSAIDAYVGAHLFDFTVDDDLSLGFGISRVGLPSVMLSLRLK